jgi:regulatory protein
MDSNSLYLKIANYCAFQERNLKEVQAKLKLWQVPNELHASYIELLTTEGYLNPERYAQSFARGKSNIKKWGKTKIKMHLKQKGIDDQTINESINLIDNETYKNTAKKLAEKKLKSLTKESDSRVAHQKVIRFLIGKGYEFDIAIKTVKEITGKSTDDLV